jgi:hypothetical protein
MCLSAKLAEYFIFRRVPCNNENDDDNNDYEDNSKDGEVCGDTEEARVAVVG